MQATREDLAEALKSLVDETIKHVPGPPYRSTGNSPIHAHSHRTPGIWDADNAPEKANKACALCAAWNRAVALGEQLRVEKTTPKPAGLRKVTITDVRRIVEAHGAAQGIVILFGGGRFASASYGTTKALCSLVAKTLDAIADGLKDGRIPAP